MGEDDAGVRGGGSALHAARLLRGGMLALSTVYFVQNRTAMLDLFLMFVVVVAAACLVTDRDGDAGGSRRRLSDGRSTPRPVLWWQPWRLLPGRR